MYNKDNIFYKIIRNQLPCDPVYEDKLFIAIQDKFPIAKVHILIIPKNNYSDLEHFISDACEKEKAQLFAVIGKITDISGISVDGYKMVVNTGKDGGQEIPHLHFHIIGGEEIATVTKK